MLLAPRWSFQQRPSLSPQGVPHWQCASKTQPRPLLSARPALCGLQPTGGAMKRKQLPTHLSLPSAAGARTSCFRWRLSDGFHRCGRCHRLVLLLAGGAGRSAACAVVRFSCASSDGRRSPGPSAWAGSHGEAALRAGGRAASWEREEAGVDVAAGSGLALRRPTCDQLCRGPGRGRGPGPSEWPAAGTGFPCTVGLPPRAAS